MKLINVKSNRMYEEKRKNVFCNFNLYFTEVMYLIKKILVKILSLLFIYYFFTHYGSLYTSSIFSYLT